jgi:hypothetical protein
VGGVVLEHVDHVVKGDEGVVDGNNLGALGNGRAEDQATDTAESINTDLKLTKKIDAKSVKRHGQSVSRI